MTLWIGIDVAKATLAVCLWPEARHFTFTNTSDGHAQLLACLHGQPVGNVLLEATGGYERTVLRALQTAELVARVVRPAEPVRVRREIAPGGDLRGLLYELVRGGASGVMLVGHEPDVSSLVAGVLAGGFTEPFQKAMVVGLGAVEGRPIERRFVLDPRSLSWT